MRRAWLLSALVVIAAMAVVWAATGGTSKSVLGGVATFTPTPIPPPPSPCPLTTSGSPLPGMSLEAPAAVFAGVPFTLCVNADPAPDVEISGFASEVLFPEGLKWQQRASCADEVLPRSQVSGPLALCLSGLSNLLGGAQHVVISEVGVPPVAALNVTLGSTTTLVELDFVCNTPGSYKLTLTALPDSDEGAVFADTRVVEIRVKTVQQDYDGDTSPNSVADTLVINCVEPPTPTPTLTPTATAAPPTLTAPPTFTATPPPPKIDTDGDGCLDNRENGPDETLGGRRDYLNFWDFFDPNRDRSVTLLDFLAVIRHFGTVGNPVTLDPDGPEPLAGEYWASADRGGQAPGGDPWDELPANGSITFADFLSVLRQFGHTCV